MKTIKAELLGAHMARSQGITVTANEPMRALCQSLLENGWPSDTPIECYRDDELCLQVLLGEGAGNG